MWEKSSRFNVIDGLTKVSKSLLMRVTSVNIGEDRIEFNGGEYVIDSMGNTLATQRGAFSTPRQFYPAEFYVGKQWHTIFRQRRPSGQTYTYRYDVQVVGRASITVPAGTFDAFKIEARGFNMQQGATPGATSGSRQGFRRTSCTRPSSVSAVGRSSSSTARSWLRWRLLPDPPGRSGISCRRCHLFGSGSV